MKITYIHYHLKTGGVTTVLKQQVSAIREKADILVITGVPPEATFPADTVIIPGLGYDNRAVKAAPPEDVAASVSDAIYSKWDQGCDLIHVHNATLAKNKNFIEILKLLQKRKFKLFIQIHDFAEDGRPSSYFEDDYVHNCHYGVINTRDYNVMIKAGLKKKGLHKIVNMIRPFNIKGTPVKPKEQVLYPIRALRRKNIGEAILMSLFFENKESLAITLPPNSPTDIKSYLDWKNYVKNHKIGIIFDAGINIDFEDLVMSSRFLITTSIMEGFGFSFLEPWIAGKYLWGRKLPAICQDFEAGGVRLDHLYTRLSVPLEWIGREQLLNKQFECILKNSIRYHYKIDKDNILSTVTRQLAKSTIDFGLLDEQFQKQIVDRALYDRKDKNKLRALNPFLSDPVSESEKDALIQHNRTAVLSNYNESIYRKRLLDTYNKVINIPVVQQINKTVLLKEFFDLNAFSLLKWGDYAE